MCAFEGGCRCLTTPAKGAAAPSESSTCTVAYKCRQRQCVLTRNAYESLLINLARITLTPRSTVFGAGSSRRRSGRPRVQWTIPTSAQEDFVQARVISIALCMSLSLMVACASKAGEAQALATKTTTTDSLEEVHVGQLHWLDLHDDMKIPFFAKG